MGIDDFMPAIFWTRYFISEQGYNIKDNCLHKERKSSILSEKNGKALISKGTKHINIRCFFITDRFRNVEVSMIWCPKGGMIGDYMTKLLQGAMLWKFRDKIIGVDRAANPGVGKFKVE